MKIKSVQITFEDDSITTIDETFRLAPEVQGVGLEDIVVEPVAETPVEPVVETEPVVEPVTNTVETEAPVEASTEPTIE